jgi:hypothetical protein
VGARPALLDLLIELLFEPSAAGIALRIRLEVRPHRLWRRLPFIVPRFRRESSGLLLELKRALEAQPRPAGSPVAGERSGAV